MKRNIENHKRKQVVLYAFVQCKKNRNVTLSQLEEHFHFYCEHIMHEAVVWQMFHGTSCVSHDVGWYLSIHTKDMNTSEFQELLRTKYSE